ncbi:MAG: lysine 5,6-aminomutase subunit alpha TIM-barrel domain-containing protein [Candidatus Limnocylindrales bacterium]
MSRETLSGQAQQVRRRAADVAAALSGPARRAATIAQERAVLRMLGVDGLDRDGQPLAASLAERYCGSDTGRLARGVILPFSVALLEYDMPPRELALDVASGAIDLRLEAELLARPDRLAAAEKRATLMLDSALERFDANRTATREMRDVLGLPAEPWLGVALEAGEVGAASAEARAIVAQGGDVVQVRVPASWEYAEARRQAGLETPGPFEIEGPKDRGESRKRRRRPAKRQLGKRVPAVEDPVPAGSQRGLASLRTSVDEAAAERRSYAALMTVTSAFAAPEQAVVAAFERIDYVFADPIREIVEDNVDPERALADHAFAHRLQARAGSRVVIGPGPLALGADLASGMPSDAATRAGRALALQALGVELALADGVAADRLVIGAVPDWAAGDGDAGSILLQTWLRRILFPGLGLVIDGPSGWLASAGGSVALVAALAGGPAVLVIETGVAGKVRAVASDLAAAARTAAAVRSSLGDGALHGDARELARQTLRVAAAVMDRLAGEGWASLLGPVGPDPDRERLGRSAVVDRADGPDSGARVLQRLL